MARIGYARVSSVGQSLEVQLDSGEKKGDYMDTLATNEWQHWLRRWDAMQMVYIPDRETRFAVMFDAIEAALPASFVALDLACGPGSLSHRLLARFPHARCVAVDLDPVLLAIGQGAVGTWGGRLRWLEGDLRGDEWADPLGDATFDAALSTTALHWLGDQHLERVYAHMGRLVKPGGVVLNGDRMRYGQRLPTIQRVCDAMATRTDTDTDKEAGAQDGTEGWRAWWTALSAEPRMHALMAKRAQRFPDDDDEAPTVETHMAALWAAGFREVDAIWQNWHNRVLMAIR